MSRLPPHDAALAERLAAAMDEAGYINRNGKPDAARLARDLGTDRGLVSKWLSGAVKRITLESHLRRLPSLLNVDPDYFRSQPSPQPHLEQVAAAVGDLLERVPKLERQVVRLQSRVRKLETPPEAASSAPRRPRRVK